MTDRGLNQPQLRRLAGRHHRHPAAGRRESAALGAWLYLRNGSETPTPTTMTPQESPPVAQQERIEAPTPIEPSPAARVLEPPATYVPKNNIVEIDISASMRAMAA